MNVYKKINDLCNEIPKKEKELQSLKKEHQKLISNLTGKEVKVKGKVGIIIDFELSHRKILIDFGRLGQRYIDFKDL